MKELTRCAQTQFDPQVVTVFCDLYEKVFRNLDPHFHGIPWNPRYSRRSDAAHVWTAALQAVDPESAVREFLKLEGSILRIDRYRIDLNKVRKIWVLGAGKAAAPMGRAVEKILGRYVAGGILITKYDHSLPLKKLEVVEAGHPSPDRKSVGAGNRLLSLARKRIESDDLVICLFSGGASCLACISGAGYHSERQAQVYK